MHKSTRWLVPCLTVLAFVAVAARPGLAAAPGPGPRRPLVIAHRGDSAHAPENTLAAFEKAVGTGVDYIELDVHLSRDDRVIVIHDETVDRTTDGHGRVADLTLAHLQALDAGSWFGAAFARERVPTLEQVLAKMKGRAKVFIELKEVEPEKGPASGRAELLAKRCLDLVGQAGMAGAARFHTFYPRNLKALKKHARGIPYDFLYNFPERIHLAVLYARAHRAAGFNPRLDHAARTEVALAHGLGLSVMPYTADTENEYQRALALKVDGIITNRPHDLVAWLRSVQ